MFNNHIEFIKNETDVHPQTGETQDRTIIDAYFYSDNVVLWGWGTYDKFLYKDKTQKEVEQVVVTAMKKEGFKVAYMKVDIKL
jgi:hypothetical protein